MASFEEYTKMRTREVVSELELRNKVEASCTMDTDGALVRGMVQATKCWGCGCVRWNDGTKCKAPGCDAYPKECYVDGEEGSA